MKVKIQVIIETDEGQSDVVEDIACLERGKLDPETLGLTLAEAKELLASVQQVVVTEQVAEYVEQHRPCPHCGVPRGCKEKRQIVFRSLFGKLNLLSPRLYTCPCQAQEKGTFSPVADLFPERTAPELLYLQTKWASLMSYGLTVDLLEEVLPIDVNHTSIHRHVQQVAERAENELGDEQFMFVEGCQRDWNELPRPAGPLVVGLDGGYIRERTAESRKAGTFEVIAGKSITDEGDARSFAFVNSYDEKPKRRLYEVLKSQGLQMNQTLIFLSDGGDTVQALQLYLSPQSEHILDWFHLTMRITVLRQMVKGLPNEEPYAYLARLDDNFERVKWYLWHGNVFMALEVLDSSLLILDGVINDAPVFATLYKRVRELAGYVANSRSLIPNYGDRYRYGERISTGFVESTINQVVSQRFAKKQQMRWTRRGAHLLLQVRVKVLNEEWRATFCRWYPSMAPAETLSQQAA